MHRLKNWRTSLTVFLIVTAIAAVYWFTMFDSTDDKGYREVADKIQIEVAEYQKNHGGSLPVRGYTLSLKEPAGIYYIIDICELLNYVPAGCAAIEGEGNDNCDAGGCECDPEAGYVWLVDSYGKVLSKCVGDDCRSNDADGFQGVWP